MIVSVTESDIGCKVDAENKCRTCPVARAINRHLAPGLEAAVVGAAFYVYRGMVRLARYDLPPSVTDFVGAFDNGRPVAAFDFEIKDLPKCFTA